MIEMLVYGLVFMPIVLGGVLIAIVTIKNHYYERR